MTKTLKQFCDDKRMTAKSLHELFLEHKFHVTEETCRSWLSGKTKPNRQYWAQVYKSTGGEVDIQLAPVIKSAEALMIETQKEMQKDLIRLEKKIDLIMEKIG